MSVSVHDDDYIHNNTKRHAKDIETRTESECGSISTSLVAPTNKAYSIGSYSVGSMHSAGDSVNSDADADADAPSEVTLEEDGDNDINRIASISEATMHTIEHTTVKESESASVAEVEVINTDTIQLIFHPPDEGTPAAAALAANAAIKISKIEKGFHKLRGMKRPKAKTWNIVKQLKKHTKKSRSKHFSTNFKGKVIDGVHELYALTAGMMLGIRCSLGKNHADINADMTHKYFNAVEKMTFPPKGCNTYPYITPPHTIGHTFKFKTYASTVFKQIRSIFQVDTSNYMMSVCGSYNFLEFISNSKSGQFFFYSHDGKYMIKTQTKDENKFLKKILPDYYAHINKNPHTMLVRILGMHRVKMYHLRRKVHFVIMTSVFDTPQKIHSIYDLKGSLIGREATAEEQKAGGVLKDMNLLLNKRKFHLGVKRQLLLDQLKIDTDFLSRLNIMDYSLLVGIHDRNLRDDNTNAIGEVEGGDTSIGGVAAAVVSQPSHSNTPFRRISVHANNSNIKLIKAEDFNTSPQSRTNDESVTQQYAEGYSSDSSSSSSSLEEGGSDSEDMYSFGDEGDSEWASVDGDRHIRLSNTPIQGQALTTGNVGIIPGKFSRNTSCSDVVGMGDGLDSHPWTNRRDLGINSTSITNKGGRGNEIYFLGVIDILQKYNIRKKAENFVKSFTFDHTQISAVHPRLYADRFMKFIADNTD